VSNTGYFLYVDGQHNGIDGMIDKKDPEVGWMKFNAAIIPYFGESSWVEGILMSWLVISLKEHTLIWNFAFYR
jgi:hypothetical protein